MICFSIRFDQIFDHRHEKSSKILPWRKMIEINHANATGTAKEGNRAYDYAGPRRDSFPNLIFI